MSRFNYHLPLLLTIVGLLTSITSTKPADAAILEPDFTRAPASGGAAGLCGFLDGPCKPGTKNTFNVNKPYDFSIIKNDSSFDITDFHLTIIGGTATWGDVDNNGFVGQRGEDSSSSIFQKTKVSTDGKTIDLTNGKIAKGEAFNPLFIVSSPNSVKIEAFFTTAVPEPSTLVMFGAMAAALALVWWRRHSQ
jgi:hypothetical protein